MCSVLIHSQVMKATLQADYNLHAHGPVLSRVENQQGVLVLPKWDLHVAKTNEPWHEISNNAICATSIGSDQPAHTRSLIRAFADRLNIL